MERLARVLDRSLERLGDESGRAVFADAVDHLLHNAMAAARNYEESHDAPGMAATLDPTETGVVG